MKVLALVTDGFGANGGIGQYNRDLATALSHCPAVSSIRIVPRFGLDAGTAIGTVTQSKPHATRLSWSWAGVREAREFEPDVIFCGHLNAVPIAATIARFVRKPLWLQLHGKEAWAAPRKWVQMAADSAILVTAVSRYTRQRFLSWSDIPPSRVKVLPNTFTARPASSPSAGAVLRTKLSLDGHRIILTVGRLSEAERYKGHDRVIAALPSILARQPDAIYLVVGEGNDQSRLAGLANVGGLADKVVFTGAVSPDALMSYFALADVFAMPSTGEGFGIVFLEAAAHGMPVVGGNRDGSVDALANGHIGRLIDPCDTNALADAIVDALAGRQPADPASGARFAFHNFENHVARLVETLAR